MSDCPNCDQAPPAETPESALTYSATAATVVGRDGVRRRVDSPLVENSNRGRGGWKAILTTKGHAREIDGETPHHVFKAASELLQANQVEFKPIDLWLNLNIQWISRAIERRQIVRLSDIMAITQGNAAPARANRNRPVVPPAVWGAKGWGAMQQELAQDVYDQGEFLVLVRMVSRWLDPVLNPSTGCADCFRHFSIAVQDLRSNPRFTQDGARRWLHAVHNSANARRIQAGDPKAKILTFEQASQTNHWL